jgi:selenocysteine-specific elongation factor
LAELSRPDGEARLTLGTAGHIDHGKTALVKALTGTDTDRLPDEHRRGISIELGYAELALPSGRRLSIVDVPGHERLVRTMVAGATGIDLHLLVVAADDGVMPQTREHVAVLRALGIDAGLIALTKIDAVDQETRRLAAEEAAALMPGAPLVAVSARTGEGLGELAAELDRLADRGARRRDRGDPHGPAVLHVDRVFTLRGIGTVITGTLRSGAIARGDRVEILPRGLAARVRSIQVHGSERERAAGGGRVALALTGVDRSRLERGDVVVTAGADLRPSYRLDVELRLEPRVGAIAGDRVQVHHGTRDVPARVVALSAGGLVQLRLEAPLVARCGERFVIRRIAPPDTLGGGVVLDPRPSRHGPGTDAVERLGRIREHGLDSVLEEERREPAMAARPEQAAPDPRLGRREALALALLDRDGIQPRAPAAIGQTLGVDSASARDSLDRLVSAGHAARVGRDLYYSARQLDRAREAALELARDRGELTIAGLRDALGTSRRYAQALLEHLDATEVTVRHGDRHVLRRGVSSARLR